jgi:hypothetical protein
MNFNTTLTTLQQLITAADELAPLLTALGIPSVSQLTAVGEAAIAIANDLKAAVEAHEDIARASDRDALDALIEKLMGTAETQGAAVDET